jgi:hypothetical protein
MSSNPDTRYPVLDRVRKLLNLARDSNNENEAASAAQRAADLMEQHEIHEAELRTLEEPDAQAAQHKETIDRLRATETRRVVGWHAALASGLMTKFHCRYYFNNGAIVFFGRLTAVQTASYTLQYLIREVERLCDAECADNSRSFRNAFRLGCASRIAQRLTADIAAPIADQPPASAGVLAIIQKDRDEVEAAYEEMSKDFGKARIGSYSSGGGFKAGVRAGTAANLGGGGRAGLPKGQGVLS